MKQHGPTALPITLQVSKPGLVELWLTRGQKLIINIYAGTAKTGKFGLRLKVPNAHGKPKLTLRLAFVSGTVDPTQTINLTIPSA